MNRLHDPQPTTSSTADAAGVPPSVSSDAAGAGDDAGGVVSGDDTVSCYDTVSRYDTVDARVRGACAPAARVAANGGSSTEPRENGRFALQSLGRVAGHDVWQAHRDAPPGAPRLLVIAGTHGDEPAPVEAALQLLEGVAPVDLDGCAIDLLPCTNPTGYEKGTRATAAGIDVNWSFDRDGVPEIELLKAWLAGRRWEAVLDLHEDWETPGFYIYEHRHGVDAAGPRIVQAVARNMAINRDAQIEGWPAREGVVTADSSRERLQRGDGFPLVLLRDHTPHKLTTETPTELPLAQRVRAQHVALQALIDHYRAGCS